jgi:hypothetical protein
LHNKPVQYQNAIAVDVTKEQWPERSDSISNIYLASNHFFVSNLLIETLTLLNE